jgi:DNA-binding MarR family transcriptional regulator
MVRIPLIIETVPGSPEDDVSSQLSLLGMDGDIREIALRFRLQKMPGYLLRRLDSRAESLYETHTGQIEITPRQFGVLLIVFQEGVISQSELGLRLHLDRSTLGEMLQRMIDRGLVTRRALPRDRRTSEIAITSLGERGLLDRVQGALEAQAALLAPLPDYLRPVFLHCLEVLADSAGLPDGEDG